MRRLIRSKLRKCMAAVAAVLVAFAPIAANASACECCVSGSHDDAFTATNDHHGDHHAPEYRADDPEISGETVDLGDYAVLCVPCDQARVALPWAPFNNASPKNSAQLGTPARASSTADGLLSSLLTSSPVTWKSPAQRVIMLFLLDCTFLV